MKNYDINKIRNVIFLGHSGAGKTQLLSSLLYNAKAVDRLTKVDDGNTPLDYNQIELDKKISIDTKLATFEIKDYEYNFIDTPGFIDFLAKSKLPTTAVENGVIVIDAVGGINIGAEKGLDLLEQKGKTVTIFINQLDKKNSDFSKILAEIKDTFGKLVVPFQLPIGKEDKFSGIIDLIKMKAWIDGKLQDIPADFASQAEEAREELLEEIAGTDEELMEKHFDAGLEEEDILKGAKTAITKGLFIPALCGSGLQNIGTDALIAFINDYLISPASVTKISLLDGEETKEVEVDPDAKPIVHVFKTVSDPHLGDMSFVRVLSGKINQGMELSNTTLDVKEKIGQMATIIGKNKKDTNELAAGEIGVLLKLKTAKTDNTLIDKSIPYKIAEEVFPQPPARTAIKVENKNDEDKLGSALKRLQDEDNTFFYEVDPELHQTLLNGMGEVHLEILMKTLKDSFKLKVLTEKPKIKYRETIAGTSDVSYKHKKQSGGRGQYGEVYIKFEPQERGGGFEFVNNIVGGVIPTKFIPAVEKGLVEALDKGIQAGYKVVDLRAILHFGSFHNVDSSEMAFKIAASQAFKRGCAEAKPVILEPIMDIQVEAPEDYLGDVLSDISSRRGKPMGMEAKGKMQIIKAQVPHAELHNYSTVLTSITSGKAFYTLEFSHYDFVPQEEAKKIIEEHAKELEENE